MTMRALAAFETGEGAAARVRAEAPDKVRPGLSWLLCGLSGRAMTVEPTDSEAADVPTRPVLTSTHLLLPDKTAGEGAAPSVAARDHAAVAHAAAHLLYSPAAQPVATLKPMGLAVVSAIEDARVERVLAASYPGVRRWFRPFVPSLPDPADLSFAALMRRLCRLLMDATLSDDNHWVNKGRDLFEAQAAIDLADIAAFRRLGSLLANDLGQMRVRFNPLQYVVPVAYRDDNSYLWDYGDAAEPPPARALGSQGAAPQPREAAPGDAQAASDEDTELGRYDYPEWDYRLARSRPDWCTVIERLPGWRAEAPLLAGLRQPRLTLPRSRRLDRARRLRRQWEGDDIDLNAAIEVMIDRRLDLAPDARFFQRPGSQPGVCSTLVLLDLSASANDPAQDGATVLDLEKRAAALLVGAVAGSGDRIAVHGFCSDTRAAVHYYRLLDPGAAPTDAALGRIAAARARYSTRLGAALRHAGELAQRMPGERRALIVVTDGAPSDIDVHDPRYLVDDAREAVLALRRGGLRVQCVALDGRAEPQLRAMFGYRGYRIVLNAAALPAALAHGYGRATLG